MSEEINPPTGDDEFQIAPCREPSVRVYPSDITPEQASRTVVDELAAGIAPEAPMPYPTDIHGRIWQFPTPDTIWKYRIPVEHSFTLEMPCGSVPLSVGVQDGAPVLWAAVDTSFGKQEQHRFYLCRTGRPLPKDDKIRFIGMFQGEQLGVFHLFDGGAEART